MTAGHFIFTISGNRFRYADQLLNIVIVLLEKVKDGVVVLTMTQKFILHLFGGNIIVTPLQFVINGVQGCVYIIQQSVDTGSFRRTSGGFTCLTVPNFGLNIKFGIETACHTINRDADKNRVTAIDFLLVLFHEEKNGKCTLHKLTFFGYKTTLISSK